MGCIEMIVYLLIICVAIHFAPYILAIAIFAYAVKLFCKLIKWIVKNRKENKNQIEIKEYKAPIETKPKKREMTEYELERFMIECNAYVIREERRKENEK